jgi:hypothetical protein
LLTIDVVVTILGVLIEEIRRRDGTARPGETYCLTVSPKQSIVYYIGMGKLK